MRVSAVSISKKKKVVGDIVKLSAVLTSSIRKTRTEFLGELHLMSGLGCVGLKPCTG